MSAIDISSAYLPRAEVDAIYGRVPRLTVEVIVRSDQGIVLSKRDIEPCKGQWHIPGGTVYFGETLEAAVRRIALRELGVEVEIEKLLGYIEYPEMLAAGYKGWPVGITFVTQIKTGKLKGSDQGEAVRFFTSVPPNTLSEQAAFLKSTIFSATE